VTILSTGRHNAAIMLVAATLFATAGLAEEPHPTRLRGTILSVAGDLLFAKSRDGTALKIDLSKNARIVAIVKASLNDIKPGSFVGITSVPGDDEERIALEVHIFPEALRGTGEGERPWDAGSGSRMTNATVATLVAAVDGQDLTVKFRGGESKIKVTPATKIVSIVVSDRSELKPGNQFIIPVATLADNGLIEPRSINVGRDGLAPPM
jgi:hypothetical protein